MTSSREKPLQFCSRGLQKSLVRLGLADEKTIVDLTALGGPRQVVWALSEAGVLKEDRAVKALANDLGLEIAELKSVKLLEKARKSGLLLKLDNRLMIERRCLPLERKDDVVFVALSDPLDMETITQLEFALSAKVKVLIAKESEILSSLDKLLGLQEAENSDDLGDERASNPDLDLDSSIQPSNLSEEAGSATAPVIKFVNQILSEAFHAHASDIHLEPSALSMEVRYRIDGVMTPQLSIPKRLQSYVTARIKILSGMDITEKRRPQDGRFRIRIGSTQSTDVRSSTVPTPFGEKLVLRLLRSEVGDLALSSLAMPADVLQSFSDSLRSRDRIVLVCGPTGSGKTTTLYSAINDLRQGHSNIITVEDPIEIRLDGITQIQVDPKVGMTFASGLRSILRQDPDIILVGEIRDLETAEVAFQAAQTGHFVISTLHTNTAVSAVVRLLDLGLEPFIVASSLGAVLSQRLVRKICTHCVVPNDNAQTVALAQRIGLNPSLLRRGAGCEICDGDGYKGRTGVYSLLVLNSAVREMIRNRASEEAIRQMGKSHGMLDLFESGLKLVEAGVTSLEEIERVIGLSEFFDAQYAAQSAPARAKPVPVAPAPIERGSLASLVNQFHEEKIPSDQARPRKILLVDDDEGVRAVMSRVLRRADFEVCEATGGQEALDKLDAFGPDMIISDVMMPGLSGKDLVELLRKNQQTSRIPILMLTGSDDEEKEIELISSGANDFVSKTSSPTLVIARIKRLLNLGS